MKKALASRSVQFMSCLLFCKMFGLMGCKSSSVASVKPAETSPKSEASAAPQSPPDTKLVTLFETHNKLRSELEFEGIFYSFHEDDSVDNSSLIVKTFTTQNSTFKKLRSNAPLSPDLLTEMKLLKKSLVKFRTALEESYRYGLQLSDEELSASNVSPYELSGTELIAKAIDRQLEYMEYRKNLDVEWGFQDFLAKNQVIVGAALEDLKLKQIFIHADEISPELELEARNAIVHLEKFIAGLIEKLAAAKRSSVEEIREDVVSRNLEARIKNAQRMVAFLKVRIGSASVEMTRIVSKMAKSGLILRSTNQLSDSLFSYVSSKLNLGASSLILSEESKAKYRELINECEQLIALHEAHREELSGYGFSAVQNEFKKGILNQVSAGAQARDVLSYKLHASDLFEVLKELQAKGVLIDRTHGNCHCPPMKSFSKSEKSAMNVLLQRFQEAVEAQKKQNNWGLYLDFSTAELNLYLRISKELIEEYSNH